ncbi:MAG: hypothetical protein RIR48_1252 [Bacteroidota bacterium]
MKDFLFLATKISVTALIISFISLGVCTGLLIISKQNKSRFLIRVTEIFQFLVLLSFGFTVVFFIMFGLTLMWF